jgi:hypothetical protein
MDNMYSSYREMLLEHLFAGAVMRHLWLDGYKRMEMLKPQVDDNGYDIVLETDTVVRHIQLKASRSDSAVGRVNINIALAQKPSGCVIWMYFNPATLELGPFLWFGGAPGEELPSLSNYEIATHTKRNAKGIKTERPSIRIVRKAEFAKIEKIDEVVVRLFGVPGEPETI